MGANEKAEAAYHPERPPRGNIEGFVVAVCLDCTPTMPMPWYDDVRGHQLLVEWAREHSEATDHVVLIPFKIYEKKGH